MESLDRYQVQCSVQLLDLDLLQVVRESGSLEHVEDQLQVEVSHLPQVQLGPRYEGQLLEFTVYC